MLAELAPQTAHERILKREDLVFEPKYDGIRTLVDIDPEPRVRIYSRLGNDKTEQFPELVAPRLCCVLCAKALEQKERSWHKVACRSRPTHKGVTP